MIDKQFGKMYSPIHCGHKLWTGQKLRCFDCFCISWYLETAAARKSRAVHSESESEESDHGVTSNPIPDHSDMLVFWLFCSGFTNVTSYLSVVRQLVVVLLTILTGTATVSMKQRNIYLWEICKAVQLIACVLTRCIGIWAANTIILRVWLTISW